MTSTLLIFVIVAAMVACFLGRNRALRLAGNDIASLHSRPNYHGAAVAIATALPALLLIPLWHAVAEMVLESRLLSTFAADLEGLSRAQVERFLSDAGNAAVGDAVSLAGSADLNARAVDVIKAFETWSDRLLAVLVVALVVGGFLARLSQPDAREAHAPRRRAHHPHAAPPRLGHRHPDDGRHRALAHLRVDPLLRDRADLRLPVRHQLVAAIGFRGGRPRGGGAGTSPPSSAPSRSSPARCSSRSSRCRSPRRSG